MVFTISVPSNCSINDGSYNGFTSSFLTTFTLLKLFLSSGGKILLLSTHICISSNWNCVLLLSISNLTLLTVGLFDKTDFGKATKDWMLDKSIGVLNDTSICSPIPFEVLVNVFKLESIIFVEGSELFSLEVIKILFFTISLVRPLLNM